MGKTIFHKDLPSVVRVRQRLCESPLRGAEEVLSEKLRRSEFFESLKKGLVIGITAGSRRIDNHVELLKSVVRTLGERGVTPVIVPAMGSHGRTHEEKVNVLSSLGIESREIGARILYPEGSVRLGSIEGDTPIYADKSVLGVDGLIVMNRVAPHTGYHGETQSGLLKMLAVGLGGREGAFSIHRHGFGAGELLRLAGLFALERLPVVCGIALVEDGSKSLSAVEVVGPGEFADKEPSLLKSAYDMYPSLPVREADILIVDEIGKDISGTGMDPLIIGRGKPLEKGRFSAKVIVALSLTPASSGNATGVGLADVITERLFRAIDFKATLANVKASGALDRARIPFIAADDLEAIKTALGMAERAGSSEVRLVRIRNTRDVSELLVSEALARELSDRKEVYFVGDPEPIAFDEYGNLSRF